ncbi:hypothetical protein PGB34_03865 [Xenophilus arseniciresistens]|uniref:Glycosyltransferase subfamily 4-like N-terminal domain-containing protein n=1 Tax=Xenophilus arseniciresistens TaxID=1283306 RepID=A0AAE3SZ52_9BURK|nr:glycosyltransferase [Xenophilus arseniciresistens]MDA7415491.1 hypothetical protein [Xenophilus arseniciresistens]
MKVLIIGSADSIFVKDFARQFITDGHSVDILSLTVAAPVQGVDRFWVVENLNSSSVIHSKIKKAVEILKSYQYINKTAKLIKDKEYDCTFIHFVAYRLAWNLLEIERISKKIVAVIWGSDLYRTNSIKSNFQKRIYRAANKIVFTNQRSIEFFERKYGNKFSSKIRVANFGLPVLDEIDLMKNQTFSRDQALSFFDFPKNKLIIMVGYNGNPLQRQLEFIAEFSCLAPVERNRFHLVFAVGYGNTGIDKKIRELTTLKGLDNYSILDKFLNFPDTAKLRYSADILVNIQPSDQLSGSMLEVLYAGGTVYAGSWLPYQDLVKAGARIYSVGSVQECVRAIAQHKWRESKAEEENKALDFIRDKASWKSCYERWRKISLETDHHH